MKRRTFIMNSVLSAAGSLLLPAVHAKPAPKNTPGFFRLSEKKGRWWLVTPEGDYIFSIGLNHIDPAAIRYLASGGIWEEKYDNSMEKWLPKVKSDLTDWGFNCLGWEQEVVIITDEMHRHSRTFTFEEYQWLDMPYFHLLPIIESHQWEWETRLPDVTGSSFREWCDYVARDKCARMKDDPKLVGYFFTDCPAWIHSNEGNSWKAPILDPELEKSENGRKEIYRVASIYYKTIVEAIKRYDPNHLIFGDRYEANAPISKEVLRAAMPYVDVFSFQCFGTVENIRQKMAYWGNYLKKPILLADSMISKIENHGWPPDKDLLQDDLQYGAVMKVLREIPECMGFHLCGAYIKNNARRYGLLDMHDRAEGTTAGIREVNHDQARWAKALAGQ